MQYACVPYSESSCSSCCLGPFPYRARKEHLDLALMCAHRAWAQRIAGLLPLGYVLFRHLPHRLCPSCGGIFSSSPLPPLLLHMSLVAKALPGCVPTACWPLSGLLNTVPPSCFLPFRLLTVDTPDLFHLPLHAPSCPFHVMEAKDIFQGS